MRRLCRMVAPLLLGLGLLCSPAWGQLDPIDEGGATESAGNPLYGYMGTAVLGAFALFVLCKSSRR